MTSSQIPQLSSALRDRVPNLILHPPGPATTPATQTQRRSFPAHYNTQAPAPAHAHAHAHAQAQVPNSRPSFLSPTPSSPSFQPTP